MRELDIKSQELLEQVDKRSKSYFRNKKQKTELASQEEKEIKENLKQALELGDEKIALASQTYELVDKHIRRLDLDLKKFEAELESQGQKTDYKSLTELQEKLHSRAEQSTSSSAVHHPTDNGKNHHHKHKKGEGSHSSNTNSNTSSTPHNDARVQVVDIDMPIDPNEPTYCICGRVSFGEMVGCDNPDCKIEWFHFECVGLTSSPKGKWYFTTN